MSVDEADDLLGRPVVKGASDLPRERDTATWFGLGAASLLLFAAMAIGGSFAAYFDLPAFLMVVGGTAAVTAISFPIDDLMRLPQVFSTALFRTVPPPRPHARKLLQLADRARKAGLFSLEDATAAVQHDPFLGEALALVVDNYAAPEIEQALKIEVQAMLSRHRVSADILRRGGEVAPAMGLIGTLVGLVQMLSGLNTPANIGPAMAVAILATLYGAVLANMILLPFAAKLDRNNHAEALIAQMTMIAAVSIATQESPRRLETSLNSILPRAARLSEFD